MQNGSISQNKTVRAAGRIGTGTGVAMIFHHFFDMPDDLREPVSGIIILVVNEASYVLGLVWRHFIKEIEDWA